jgi:uncharacterized repeat protein (TIGR03803 family)
MSAKRVILALAATVVGIAHLAHANPTLTTLATFNSTNGASPDSVALGTDGNLYGETYSGGANGDGTAFELTGANYQTLATLANFNGTNGTNPGGGLTADATGNLYGTAFYGGASNDGTVFELSGTNHQTLAPLLSYNGTNGANPEGGLAADAAGNLYGTALQGGTQNSNFGAAFELSGASHQTFTALATFNNLNGANPGTNLASDAAGNLYGATFQGGSSFDGTVFELSGITHKTLTTLASFSNGFGADALTFGPDRNLYGATSEGGANGDGSVFELSGANHMTLSTLLSFNGTDGSDAGNLVADAAGDLFGTTFYGGSGYNGSFNSGYGSIFELSGANHQTLTTLLSFNGTNGSGPNSLIADAAGDLYGTTEYGGANNDGTAFELTNTGFVVPEPNSLSLLAIGGLHLLRRRRRIA